MRLRAARGTRTTTLGGTYVTTTAERWLRSIDDMKVDTSAADQHEDDAPC